MLKFDILTIFPDIFTDYFSTSIIKRAQQKKLVKIKIHNLRDWAKDKHKTVDDKPYGGGPGMVLKADIIYKAIAALRRLKIKDSRSKVILLTPTGKQFTQKIAQSFSQFNQLVLICGHYEGVDARVEKFVDEKISVGPYILTGGELPAMVIVDAVTRLIPGVIKKESLEEESFSQFTTEYPQYTRPEVLTIKDKYSRIKTLRVPKVLLSGNHQKIKEWRNKQIAKSH